MHVLVVSHAYPGVSNPWHGSFIHKWNVELQRLGTEIDVLQLSEWSPPWPLASLDRTWREAYRRRRDQLDTCDGIRIHHPRAFYPRPHRFFPRDHWQVETQTLAEYCKRHPRLRNADVAIGHFMVPDGYHALGLARALGIPAVGVAWGDDVHAWPERLPDWRRRLEMTLQGLDRVVACSKRLALDANRWLSVPRDDWHIVYAGVDREVFRPRPQAPARNLSALHGIPQDARILLTIAQRVVAKGYLDLLAAWERLHGDLPEWHLVMVGVDRGDVDVVEEVRTRGLSARAHWLGPQKNVPGLLQAADAFVLASHNEGLSLSVVEALASGLPVVATDVGGHAEVITTPEEGWLIPPGSVAGLVDALRSACHLTEAERQARALAARAAATRYGTPGENATRLDAVLRACASGSDGANARSPQRASPARLAARAR